MGYRLDYVDRITLRELIDIISSYETRFEFSALTNEGSFIKTDGGILILKKEDDPSFQRIVLAVEMKRQGTNDQRALEGKGEQSQGKDRKSTRLTSSHYGHNTMPISHLRK